MKLSAAFMYFALFGFVGEIALILSRILGCASNDPVQIFYATLSPTVMSNGTQVRIAVITTTNASAVKLQVGSQSIGLSQTSPGQWQAAFPFPAGSTPSGQNAQTFPLIASRSDGSSATISIPATAAP